MPDHPATEVQLDRFLNCMGLATLVTCFLQHPEHSVVTLDMIVGPIHILPAQLYDHLVKLLFADLFQRFG
jgi:hypothetical protein